MVSRATSADEALRLAYFDPDELIDARIAPVREQLSSQLHSSTCRPEEDETFVLKYGDRHRAHVVVAHGSIRQRHVDVPGWIGKDDVELAQHRVVKILEIAVDPLCLLLLDRTSC